jgi:hypothetical protein
MIPLVQQIDQAIEHTRLETAVQCAAIANDLTKDRPSNERVCGLLIMTKIISRFLDGADDHKCMDCGSTSEVSDSRCWECRGEIKES